ncbi:putative protein phosphatase slingshot [Paratrimastix pyriformis]|uniref:protein-tyrosine-phosphatase n=1 Tax=Paratrimastix pyriformis TaxID=342808 RepID=A0ABQ8UHF1_9EUKA|nr:putative protein phosphatase slingshot [Paratrimastix pyriformis]
MAQGPMPRHSFAFPNTPPNYDELANRSALTKILPFLYLGNVHDATVLPVKHFQDNQISHWINCAREVQMSSAQRALLQKGVISYTSLGMCDTLDENIFVYLKKAFLIIERARQESRPCCVYCRCGVSRSATVVCSYLLWYYSIALDDALRGLMIRRSCVRPNPSFLAQMVQLEQIKTLVLHPPKESSSAKSTPPPSRASSTQPEDMSIESASPSPALTTACKISATLEGVAVLS